MPHEFEYPKWLHHTDHASVVVDDPAAEAAQIVAWRDAAVAPAGNSLVGTAKPPDLPKQRGGWPKGKSRKPNQATVN